MVHDSMSKDAKPHTYHTNLFITYYCDVLGPIFGCGFKTNKKVLKYTVCLGTPENSAIQKLPVVIITTWERNPKEARKYKRTRSDGANLAKSCIIDCVMVELWCI